MKVGITHVGSAWVRDRDALGGAVDITLLAGPNASNNGGLLAVLGGCGSIGRGRSRGVCAGLGGSEGEDAGVEERGEAHFCVCWLY